MRAQKMIKSNLNIYKTIVMYQCAIDLYLQSQPFHNGIWYENYSRKDGKGLSIDLIKADIKLSTELKLLMIGYIQSFEFSLDKVNQTAMDLCSGSGINMQELTNDDKVMLIFVLSSIKALDLTIDVGLKAYSLVIPQAESIMYDIISKNNQKVLWGYESSLSEYENKFKYSFSNKLKEVGISLSREDLEIWSDRAKNDYLYIRLRDNDANNYWYSGDFIGSANSIALLIDSFKKFYFPSWFAAIEAELNSDNGTIVGESGISFSDDTLGVVRHRVTEETIDFPKTVRSIMRASANLYRAQNVNGFDAELDSCYKTILTLYKEKKFAHHAAQLNNNADVKRFNNRAFLFTSTVTSCSENNMAGQKRYNNADKLFESLCFSDDLSPSYIDKVYREFKHNIGDQHTTNNTTRLLTTKYLKSRVQREHGDEIEAICAQVYMDNIGKIGVDESKLTNEKRENLYNSYMKTYTELYFIEILQGAFAIKTLVKQLEDWHVNPLCIPSSVRSLKEMSKYRSLREYLTYVDLDTVDIFSSQETKSDKELIIQRAFATQLLSKLDKAYIKFMQETEQKSVTNVNFNPNNLVDYMNCNKSDLDVTSNDSREIDLIESEFKSILTNLNYMNNIYNLSVKLGNSNDVLLDIAVDNLIYSNGSLFDYRAEKVKKSLVHSNEEIGDYHTLVIKDHNTLLRLIRNFTDASLIFRTLMSKDITPDQYMYCIRFLYNKFRMFFFIKEPSDFVESVHQSYLKFIKRQEDINHKGNTDVKLTPKDICYCYLQKTSRNKHKLLDVLSKRPVNYDKLTPVYKDRVLNNPQQEDLSILCEESYVSNLHSKYKSMVENTLVYGIYNQVVSLPSVSNSLGLKFLTYLDRLQTTKDYVEYIQKEMLKLDNSDGFNIIKDIKYTARYNVLDSFIVRLGTVESCYNQLQNYFVEDDEGNLAIVEDYLKHEDSLNNILVLCRQALSYFVKELPLTYSDCEDSMIYDKLLVNKLYTFYIIFKQLHKVNLCIIPGLNRIRECSLSLRDKLIARNDILRGVSVRTFPLDLYPEMLAVLPEMIHNYYAKNKKDEEEIISLSVEASNRELVQGLDVYGQCLFKHDILWVAVESNDNNTYVDFKAFCIYGIVSVNYNKKSGVITITDLDSNISASREWIEPIVTAKRNELI